jgi:hypothetical protein
MTNKTEWQEANRRLMAEQREKLGEPPTAEEMLAYSRGELSAEEEDRIRDLLVAYPEVARMYGAPFEEEPQAGVSDETSHDAIRDGWDDVQRRLGATVMPARLRVRNYIPTTIAAALALLFFGLYVQAESRARDHARGDLPRVLGAPQELNPDGSRSGTPRMLRKDGDAYLLKPQLINQLHAPHYSIELHDTNGPVWGSPSAQPDSEGAFQIVIPHDFLRPGVRYQLRIFGIDGDTRRPVGSYDVMVPSE